MDFEVLGLLLERDIQKFGMKTVAALEPIISPVTLHKYQSWATNSYLKA